MDTPPEDDMKPSIDVKKKELIAFHTHHKEAGYTLKGCTYYSSG